jgi:hypothetical protein
MVSNADFFGSVFGVVVFGTIILAFKTESFGVDSIKLAGFIPPTF